MSDKIEEVLFYTLDHTYRKKQSAAQKYFNEIGIDITPEQWVVLKILDQYEGISQKELAERAAKDTASVTRMLDILEKKELLKREPVAGDRRKYNVYPTKAGKKFIKDNLKHVITLRQKALEGLTQNDIKTLKEMLLKIQNNLE